MLVPATVVLVLVWRCRLNRLAAVYLELTDPLLLRSQIFVFLLFPVLVEIPFLFLLVFVSEPLRVIRELERNDELCERRFGSHVNAPDLYRSCHCSFLRLPGHPWFS